MPLCSTWLPRKPTARAAHVTSAKNDRQHRIGRDFRFFVLWTDEEGGF